MDYTSYLVANLKDKQLITEESIKLLFSRFDFDKQGFLNIYGFHKALRRTGKLISEYECEIMDKEDMFKNPNILIFLFKLSVY